MDKQLILILEIGESSLFLNICLSKKKKKNSYHQIPKCRENRHNGRNFVFLVIATFSQRLALWLDNDLIE